jgi:hypothetical protein
MQDFERLLSHSRSPSHGPTVTGNISLVDQLARSTETSSLTLKTRSLGDVPARSTGVDKCGAQYNATPALPTAESNSTIEKTPMKITIRRKHQPQMADLCIQGRI